MPGGARESCPRRAMAPAGARGSGLCIRRCRSRSYLAAREPASPPRPLEAAARPRGGGDAAGPRRRPGWGSAGPGPPAGAASRSVGRRRGSPPAFGPGRPPCSRSWRPTSGCPGATPRPSPPPFPLPLLPPPLPPPRPLRPRSLGCRGSTPAASTTRAEGRARPRLRPAGPARPPAGCAPSRSPGPCARGGRPPSAGRGPPLGARAAAAAARGSGSPSRSLALGPPSPRAPLGVSRRRSHVPFFPGPPPPAPRPRPPRRPTPLARPLGPPSPAAGARSVGEARGSRSAGGALGGRSRARFPEEGERGGRARAGRGALQARAPPGKAPLQLARPERPGDNAYVPVNPRPLRPRFTQAQGEREREKTVLWSGVT